MFRNAELIAERELLRACNGGDAEARAHFSSRSYQREVFRAVRIVLQDHLPAEEVEAFAYRFIQWVFQHPDDVPWRFDDLHTRLRRMASASARKYWKKRRKTLKMP